MTYPAPPDAAAASRARPAPGQFWAGAVATAVVAALIALVGILVCRWTLGIPILAPASDGAWGDAHTSEDVLRRRAAADPRASARASRGRGDRRDGAPADAARRRASPGAAERARRRP